MSELPKNWTITKVQDIGDAVTGNTPSTKQKENYGDHIPFVKPPNLLNSVIANTKENLSQVGMEKGRVAPENSILVSCIGNLGKIGINKSPVAFNQQINAILPHAEINPSFVFYQTQSAYFRSQLEEYSSATTISIINKGNFEKLNFRLAPYNEQKRIVAKIEALFSELDKGIESLKTVREQLKIYRQAVLKHAFEGKLTADWREDNKDKLETAEELLANISSERFKKLEEPAADELKKLPSLPKSWKYARLGYFIENIGAGKSFKCDEREPKQDEVGVAKVSAVTWGEYDESESKTCTNPEKVNSSYFIEPDDFLFSRANTIELVGACVIAKKVTKSIMLSDKTLRIKFEDINPYYFLYYLRAQAGRNEIMKRSTGNQDSMRNIGQERIKNIVVPICSTEETEQIQKEIQFRFSIIDNFEEIIDSELQKTEALRQSILKQAFSGKLVAQDPSDEPASVLLERIKAEKDGNKKKRNAA
ncbi:restriction endonuclease subunit S [Nitrosomonas marina]|uniref:Type I restriction enzyme, S subunit n=1 Tax=Nitrosomonas marina TaxID=917 RepID=A0A1H8HDS3_9PROT|nr:restriction endonuclease subunit S [Nitrosomonas marina]SEN54017.1 type I restriction enzyme, S subunit [Nitrosomonas marina]